MKNFAIIFNGRFSIKHTLITVFYWLSGVTLWEVSVQAMRRKPSMTHGIDLIFQNLIQRVENDKIFIREGHISLPKTLPSNTAHQSFLLGVFKHWNH